MPPEAPKLDTKLSVASRIAATVFVLATVGIAVGLAVAGVAEREATIAQLRETATERARPTVNAARPSVQPNTVGLELPGRFEAIARAEIYARVNGFVASWTHDIGSTVKAGDVMAEVDAPDLDQQLFQAQSDLASARIAEQLSDATNQRFQALLPNNTISRQTAEDKVGDLAAKRGAAKSAQANVDRLVALSKFKKITAPFDGTVTARNTDTGSLITAQNSTGSPLFVVADTRRLRLFINVPQNSVPLVKLGTTARITVPERPGKVYAAKVEATSGAVDLASGTSRMQLVVDNAAGELLAGGYASVTLGLTNPIDVLTVPASALIVDKNGLSVAVVVDGVVTRKRVTIARDLGNAIEIASGLAKDDLVIESPPDGLVDGDLVRVKNAEKKPTTPSADIAQPAVKG